MIEWLARKSSNVRIMMLFWLFNILVAGMLIAFALRG